MNITSVCKYCGTEIRHKRYSPRSFCSSSCSAKFNNVSRIKSAESKIRTSNSVRRSAAKRKNYKIRHCKCRECGVEYCSISRPQTQTKACSYECANRYKRTEHYRANCRTRTLKRIAEGKHTGWKTRYKLQPSYPEKYFTSLFENEGISFEREVPCDRFFIDFVIGNIALEIDGKQHEYPAQIEIDKRKNIAMQNHGYKIFRIKWINPTSDKQKALLYAQIQMLKQEIQQNNKICNKLDCDVN